MDDQRALAISGDPDRIWVGAAAGGAREAGRAKQSAIDECNRKRLARRLRSPCRLYAVGDRVVWGERR
jgi:hypothetical protein